VSAVAPTRSTGGRRVRLLVIVTVIGASALALLAWTQTWVLADLIIQGTATARIDVTGSTAAPALTALALAGLALAGALTIAGPVIRVVLGVLETLLGVSVFLAAVTAVIDPAGACAAAVTAATGIAGHKSIQAGVASATLTGWPYLALVAAGIMVVAGISVLSTQHRWPGPTTRYQAVRMVPASTDADEGAASDGVAPADESAARRSDSVGDWDDLSRGEDPTA
jgi:uncharacterized membrane protein (TIGR02234 family)